MSKIRGSRVYLLDQYENLRCIESVIDMLYTLGVIDFETWDLADDKRAVSKLAKTKTVMRDKKDE